MKKKMLLMLLIAPWFALAAYADDDTTDTSYQFVCTDWTTGDTVRVTADSIAYDSAANTITVSVTGANNVALQYWNSNSTYTWSSSLTYLVVKAKGLDLSTSSNSYLWFLNGKNSGTNVEPTYQGTLDDGTQVVAWKIASTGLNAYLSTDGAALTGRTLFGLTTDSGGVATVSHIGFLSDDDYFNLVKTPYQFVCTEWSSGDTGRVTADSIAYDSDANTITVSKTGDNNVTLTHDYSDTPYYWTSDLEYLVVVAQGLDLSSGKSYLWWLNGKNANSQVQPISTTTLSDGTQVVAWKISETGLNAYLSSDTCSLATGKTIFGLTTVSAAVISYIGYVSVDGLWDLTHEPYRFVCTEWSSGAPGRVTADSIAHDSEANTITVSKTGDNNVTLTHAYSGTTYYWTSDLGYLIIAAQGLDLSSGKSLLRRLNGQNTGSQVVPTSTTWLSDGAQVVAWKIPETELNASLSSDTCSLATGKTISGLTTDSTAVISYIGFAASVDHFVAGITAPVSITIATAGWPRSTTAIATRRCPRA